MSLAASLDDVDDEATETIALTLTGQPVGYTISDGYGIINLTDNDPAPTVSLSTNAMSVSEGAGTALVTVTMSTLSYQTVVVSLSGVTVAAIGS